MLGYCDTTWRCTASVKAELCAQDVQVQVLGLRKSKLLDEVAFNSFSGVDHGACPSSVAGYDSTLYFNHTRTMKVLQSNHWAIDLVHNDRGGVKDQVV